MNDKHKIFLGYFSSAIAPSRIAEFAYRQCRGLSRVEVIRKLEGYAGKQYCCCLHLDTADDADAAKKVFQGMKIDGRALLCRPWEDRTGANERRDVNWRSRSWADPEQRARERRALPAWCYVYEPGRGGAARTDAALGRAAARGTERTLADLIRGRLGGPWVPWGRPAAGPQPVAQEVPAPAPRRTGAA